MTSLRFVEQLRDLVGGVEVVLSDIWGVVHNGLESFPEACAALHSYRQQGGTVILITNAPRPADSVQRQLRKLGVADETYDAIVSSGDLTRHFVADHPGKKIYWVGPDRDSSIHRGLDAVMTPLEAADYIICTGLFDDETESAEDYRAMLTQALERKLPLICANPDIVVERGDRLIYCAGAVAELYRELGGEVIFYGKPHRPIYERAMQLAAERRGHASRAQQGAGDRRFRPHGSRRRPWFRDRLPVRHPRHPCRGIRRGRPARPGLGEGIVRPPAPRPDAGVAVVRRRLLPQNARRHARESGYPVRRGLSFSSLTSLEYWVARVEPGDDSCASREVMALTPSPYPERPPRSWSSASRR